MELNVILAYWGCLRLPVIFDLLPFGQYQGARAATYGIRMRGNWIGIDKIRLASSADFEGPNPVA